MSNELTPKQEEAAQAFIECGDKSEAYRRAYATANMKPETINRAAFELFENPKIAARIAELKSLHLKRHEVTIDRVVDEYRKLAFLDIRKIFDEEGNLLPIHEMDADTAAAISGLEVEKVISKIVGEALQSHTHKIKLVDKKGALDSLAKYLGMFVDRTEITGKDGGPLQINSTKEQRDAAVAAALAADA